MAGGQAGSVPWASPSSMRRPRAGLMLLLLASLTTPGGSKKKAARRVPTAARLEADVVSALRGGRQEAALEAVEAYRQHLTLQLEGVSLAQGLQAMFEMDAEPRSMYEIMSMWLDSFGHVDAFYRAQEAVMLARVARHEQSGQPIEALFARFSEEPVFRFFHPSLMFPADPAALALARGVDPALTARLLAVGDSAVGYIPELLQATHPPDAPTMNTCRHTKRLVLLLHQLEQDGAVARAGGWGSLRVAEIGGGNGNMARLVGASVGFGSWTIFDFPIMSRLQRWYLNETLGTTESNGGGGYDTVSNLEPLTARERRSGGGARGVV